MSRLKTFAKYAIWIILFWILSDILIYYGVNSTYKNLKIKNEVPSQVTIKNAEATKVNGRIKGTIFNNAENKLTKQYIKHPMEVVNVGDIVTCWVDDINLDRHKVSLTLIDPEKNL